MINLNNLKFFKTPLELELLRLKVEENPDLKRLIINKKIINDAVDEEIRVRTKGDMENFMVILIHGKAGSIKSSVALELIKKINPSFTKEGICFQFEELKAKLMNSKKGDCFTLDEVLYMHGAGTIRLINEIQNMVETLRKRQNSLIFCCVTPKYFPEESFTMVLETIDKCLLGTCEKNLELHEIRNCPHGNGGNQHSIKKAFVRLAVKQEGKYLGLYIQEISWDNDLWKEYTPIKDAFVDNIPSQSIFKFDYEKKANELLQLPDAFELKGKSQFKLLVEKNIPNLTQEEKELLVEQMRMIYKINHPAITKEDIKEKTEKELE